MRKNFYLILFGIFITIILVLCSACVDTNGNDDDDTPEQPETCIFNYGQKTRTTVIIYGIKENVTDSVLTIPQMIDGKTVIEIGSCAFRCNAYGDTVKTINIPFNVNKIGYEAFKNCDNLETINLNYGGETNSNLKEIEKEAFANCSSLKVVNGSTPMLKKIGYKAFENCQNLISTGLDDSNVLSEIGFSAFLNCYNLISFNLPETITQIEYFAFKNSGINSVYIAENAVISYSFVECANLATITVNENNELYTAVDNVLYSCNGGSNVLLCYPNKRNAFDSIITSFTVPQNVNGIAEYAFSGNNHLQSIDLNNAKYIREEAFKNCTALRNVYGNKIDTVLDDAFLNTPWLTENMSDFVVLGKALVKYNGSDQHIDLSQYNSVSAYAFYGNEQIETVSFGDHMSNVGKYAFALCVNLHTAYVGNVNFITFISQSVFDDVNENFIIFVAAPLIETYKQETNWSDYIDRINTHNTVVTLYKNNGENDNVINIAYGANAALPNPTRAGFTFLGWYTQDGTNDNWGEQITPNTVWKSFNGTINLYAKWTRK